jgi:hypothetical protein
MWVRRYDPEIGVIRYDKCPTYSGKYPYAWSLRFEEDGLISFIIYVQNEKTEVRTVIGKIKAVIKYLNWEANLILGGATTFGKYFLNGDIRPGRLKPIRRLQDTLTVDEDWVDISCKHTLPVIGSDDVVFNVPVNESW